MIPLAERKDTARLNLYPSVMAKRRQRPITASSLASNLQVLMDAAGWTQTELDRRSGVSQRHISDILAGKAECTVPVANELASAFGLHGWHLLLPNLPKDLVGSPAISKLVDAYIGADTAGREFMDAAAKRETKRKV